MKKIIRAKLTKKFLMGLTDGLYLVSNCENSVMDRSIYEGFVRPRSLRESQWREIVASKANHRFCFVCRSPSDYEDATLEARCKNKKN